MIDDEIIRQLKEAGIDFACGVPCSMLKGVLQKINNHINYVSVTREEEGIGVCVGASLGGKKPALLMQNSGLGNCVNALLSLVKLYAFPLLLLIANRGGPEEKIVAQIPMGKATPKLLRTLEIEFVRISKKEELDKIKPIAESAFNQNKAKAILFGASLWKE
jgi:sulfopyruvate decarboxylase subunit alpha